MSEADLFRTRRLLPEDVPFLYNSWLKSYRDSPTVQSISNTVYYAEQHKLIERLLQAPEAKAVVACNPEDPTQIYGYIVYQPDVLHWVYVKHTFRGAGIARMLVAEAGLSAKLIYTHRVKNSERLVGERDATYNPYLLYKV